MFLFLCTGKDTSSSIRRGDGCSRGGERGLSVARTLKVEWRLEVLDEYVNFLNGEVVNDAVVTFPIRPRKNFIDFLEHPKRKDA